MIQPCIIIRPWPYDEALDRRIQADLLRAGLGFSDPAGEPPRDRSIPVAFRIKDDGLHVNRGSVNTYESFPWEILPRLNPQQDYNAFLQHLNLMPEPQFVITSSNPDNLRAIRLRLVASGFRGNPELAVGRSMRVNVPERSLHSGPVHIYETDPEFINLERLSCDTQAAAVEARLQRLGVPPPVVAVTVAEEVLPTPAIPLTQFIVHSGEYRNIRAIRDRLQAVGYRGNPVISDGVALRVSVEDHNLNGGSLSFYQAHADYNHIERLDFDTQAVSVEVRVLSAIAAYPATPAPATPAEPTNFILVSYVPEVLRNAIAGLTEFGYTNCNGGPFTHVMGEGDALRIVPADREINWAPREDYETDPDFSTLPVFDLDTPDGLAAYRAAVGLGDPAVGEVQVVEATPVPPTPPVVVEPRRWTAGQRAIFTLDSNNEELSRRAQADLRAAGHRWVSDSVYVELGLGSVHRRGICMEPNGLLSHTAGDGSIGNYNANEFNLDTQYPEFLAYIGAPAPVPIAPVIETRRWAQGQRAMFVLDNHDEALSRRVQAALMATGHTWGTGTYRDISELTTNGDFALTMESGGSLCYCDAPWCRDNDYQYNEFQLPEQYAQFLAYIGAPAEAPAPPTGGVTITVTAQPTARVQALLGNALVAIIQANPAGASTQALIRSKCNHVVSGATTAAEVFALLDALVDTGVVAVPASTPPPPPPTPAPTRAPRFTQRVRYTATEVYRADITQDVRGEGDYELTHAELEEIAGNCSTRAQFIRQVRERIIEEAQDSPPETDECGDEEISDREHQDTVEQSYRLNDNEEFEENLLEFLNEHPELDPEAPETAEEETAEEETDPATLA